MYSNIIIKLLITLLATIITLSLFGGISSLISRSLSENRNRSEGKVI